MPGLDETQTLRPLHADAQAGNRLLRVDEATDAVRALVEIRTAPTGATPLQRPPIGGETDPMHLGARCALPAAGAGPDRYVRARFRGARRSSSRDAAPSQALLSSSRNPSKASSWAGSSKGPDGTTGGFRSGGGGGAGAAVRGAGAAETAGAGLSSSSVPSGATSAA